MIRIILIALGILIFLLTFKLLLRIWALIYTLRKSGIFTFMRANSVRNGNQQQKATDNKTMVKCATCQVYIPQTEAITKGAKYYCSKECIS